MQVCIRIALQRQPIRFAAVFLGIAGLLMLWIKEPPIIRAVDDVTYLPAGH